MMMKRMNGKHRRISRKAPRRILRSLKRLEPSLSSLGRHWCSFSICGSCATCAFRILRQQYLHVEYLLFIKEVHPFSPSNFIRIQLKEKTGELIDSSWKEQRNRHLLMKMLELEEPTVTAKVIINSIHTLLVTPAEMVEHELNFPTHRWLIFFFRTGCAIFY